MARPTMTAAARDHSTSTATAADDVRHALRKLALSTWEDHIQDVTDGHRWLEGFLESVQLAHTQAASQGIKPAMSELMKTPGRKRLGLSNTAQLQQNHASASASGHHSTTAVGAKDPVATLLFPNAPASRYLRPNQGKENSSFDPSPARTASPRGASPAPSRIAQAKSPLRTASPRPGLLKSSTSFKTLSAISAMSPPTSASKALADLSMDIDSPANVSRSSAFRPTASTSKAKSKSAAADKSYAMDDDDDVVLDAIAAADAMDQVEASTSTKAASTSGLSHVRDDDDTAALDAAATAELSMIGEEEEDEDDQIVAAPSSQSARAPPVGPASSVIIPETQAPALAFNAATQSPRSRVVSTASSIAEEADADSAVPLNDAPSLLRNATATPSNHALSPSLPASANATARTPGGSTTSNVAYGVGSYSAAKVGAIGLGSSPPPASAAGRKSMGGKGPSKPLKFVSIPKKSIGLGLVRNWATSSTTDSQQSSGSQASSIGQVLAGSTTTSTGAMKRKSLHGDEGAPLSKRTDQDVTMNHDDSAASGRSTLMNRMREMQSRQSTIAGPSGSVLSASSRLSGINGLTTMTHKPISSSSSIVIASTGVAPPPALAASTPVEAAAAPTAPATTAAPRPSVMERVKSFERAASPTASSSKLPLSPSRIARPMSPVTRSATAAKTMAPPQSPRIALSPTLASSFSKFGSSSNLASHTAVPATAPLRSPRIAAAAAKLTSPPPYSPAKTTTRSSPVVPNKSPARVANMALQRAQQQGSTTPKNSPPVKTKMTDVQTLMKEVEEACTADSARAPSRMAKSTRVVDDDEEMFERDDDRLLDQLPPRIEDDEDDGYADDESDEDGSGIKAVVEKDRGALAGAMDTQGGALKKSQSKMNMPGAFGADHGEEEEDGDRSIEFIEPTRFKPTTASSSSIRQPTLHKKTSQSSLASSVSSQAPSRPGSSLLKNSTSSASHIKSVQAAERVRQKQQDGIDRKAAQKLEVQQKRAELAQKKKAEEDRARREELERRRKEREERERKLKQQRPEIKKPQQMRPPAPNANGPTPGYGASTQSSLSSSQPGRSNAPGGLGSSQPIRPVSGTSSTQVKSTTSSMVGVKYVSTSTTVGVSVASGSSSSSTAPRAIAPPQYASKPFAPVQVSKPVPPPPAAVETYPELPDIDSEYSDSGDEEGRAQKAAAMPEWAQSPALAAALYAQQQVNPSDIFGPIPPLQMHEIFKNANLSRLTKRTSSACWEGTDALTQDDLRRYDRAMGYTRQSVSEYAARQ